MLLKIYQLKREDLMPKLNFHQLFALLFSLLICFSLSAVVVAEDINMGGGDSINNGNATAPNSDISDINNVSSNGLDAMSSDMDVNNTSGTSSKNLDDNQN